ncbi:MAG: hypothetical protein KTR29_06780 [Rhodothermaceae bacterium]|nr:hypothetical protein [Rhodothermaceae bacterium]
MLSIEAPADRAYFGDMFGVVNTLFSGLAFAALIYAILLQQKGLDQNTQALQLQAQELARATENHKAATRVELFRQLTDRMTDINNYFKDSGLPNPYDDGKKKDMGAYITYEKKGTALLLHLNLLYLVYVNKETLGPEIETVYKTWFLHIVYPWIKNDPDIRANWNEAKDHGDLFGESFFKWVSSGVISTTE